MRFFQAFAATLALACAATAGTTLTSYADPATPGPEPVLPEVAQAAEQAAEEALANAEAALTGAGEVEPTLALVELAEVLPELEGAERRSAERILARPDGDAPLISGEPRYAAGTDRAHCGPHICVHYVRSGPHRVSLADRDGDDVPNWVETNLSVMERTWSTEIGRLDYRAPRRDGTRGTIPGRPRTAGKIDVYLAQLQGGLFGYAQPESDPAATSDGSSRTNTAHMVLDADFAGFSCRPSLCLKATAAHEFFHVVQFGYDTFEQPWLLESTATWVEERVFDGADDNRNYLSESSMRLPARSVDTDSGPTWYGNWIFHEFLSRRLGHDVVRQTWERARPGSVNARMALDATLRSHGTSLRAMFETFGIASNAPRAYWLEGAAGNYPAATSSAGKAQDSVPLDHLTSANYVFTPDDHMGNPSLLKINVNAPETPSTASALVQEKDGTLRIVRIPLDPTGAGTVTVPFDAATVAKVFLNLGNASTRDNLTTTYQTNKLP